jgi:alkylhydroperoxidase/carboxymuconolactone decarboxylase family protein YurZ
MTLHQSEESKQRGRRVRKAISGSEGSRSTGNAAGLDMIEGLEDFVIGFNFGEIWARDQLDLKTRCMVVLGMLTAMGRTPQVTAYTRYALHLGITPEEIAEVLLQAVPYAGLPAAFNGMQAASDVFAEQGVSVKVRGM